MISVEKATEIIFSHRYKPDSAMLPLIEAGNHFLDETVNADRDFPPFDRVTMDGIAISYEKFARGQREFEIEDTQAAGVPRKRLKNDRNCMEVMTGAIIPEETDMVVRYEDVEIKDGKARILSDEHAQGQHIHKQGIDVREGSLLAVSGTLLSPAEIALLASVGKSLVRVKRHPKTAVVSTGDELVEVTETPKMHQIRRSNSYALAAALKQAGVVADMYHIPDREQQLGADLWDIAADHEMVILTGGVSKGKFDFVPGILEKLGVKRHFHGVKQRPGKPFWFGTTSVGKTFFALPGNPVSTYMCFYRYIHPWLSLSMGDRLKSLTAILSEDFTFAPNLTYFLQVKVLVDAGRLVAVPSPGGGSGDFANLGQVDGFLELPAERMSFKAGEVFPYIPFRLLE
jgi:molybdopterin molybdotransferase